MKLEAIQLKVPKLILSLPGQFHEEILAKLNLYMEKRRLRSKLMIHFKLHKIFLNVDVANFFYSIAHVYENGDKKPKTVPNISSFAMPL